MLQQPCSLTEDHFMVGLTHTYHQASLIHFVESDDLFLHDQVDVVWFGVLNTLDYHALGPAPSAVGENTDADISRSAR